MSAICVKALCLCFSELKGDYWQERESAAWIEDLSGVDSYCLCLWSDLSEPLSCLSACCLTSVWCSAGLREDQALPVLALPLSGALRTHQTSPLPPRPWTNELFLSKNMCSVLDHQKNLNNGALGELAEQSKKTRKRQPDLIPSSLTIARGLRHDPDGPCLCFGV